MRPARVAAVLALAGAALLAAGWLLLERGLVDSRTRAQALILAGKVLVNEQRIDKAGTKVLVEAEIRIKEADHYRICPLHTSQKPGCKAASSMWISD